IALVEMCFKLNADDVYDTDKMKKLSVYSEFCSNIHDIDYYTTYTKVKGLLNYRKMFNLYEKYLPMPYLYRMEKTLIQIGFPTVAAAFIHEYLRDTWSNTREGRLYVF